LGDETLKDFTVNWMIGGLLIFCLLAFSISFVYNNNTDALNDGTSNVFSSTQGNYSGNLLEAPSDANSLLNITSNTNPEVSDLGSRDSVAVSYEAKGSAAAYWEGGKYLIGWVFAGTSGKILLGVFGGIISLSSMFFIWRFIKG